MTLYHIPYLLQSENDMYNIQYIFCFTSQHRDLAYNPSGQTTLCISISMQFTKFGYSTMGWRDVLQTKNDDMKLSKPDRKHEPKWLNHKFSTLA